jgi:hypothetical protein
MSTGLLVETSTRPEGIEFFLRLPGLWEALVVILLPPPAPTRPRLT